MRSTPAIRQSPDKLKYESWLTLKLKGCSIDYQWGWSKSEWRHRNKIPEFYDGGGPDGYRVVLSSIEVSAACYSMDELSQAVRKAKFPMAEFACKYPVELARLIASFAEFCLPLYEGCIWDSCASKIDIQLKDYYPQVIDDQLVWFEPKFPKGKFGVLKRRLRLNPQKFGLVGGAYRNRRTALRL